MTLRRGRRIEGFDDFVGIGFQLSYATFSRTMWFETCQFLLYPHFPYHRARFIYFTQSEI